MPASFVAVDELVQTGFNPNVLTLSAVTPTANNILICGMGVRAGGDSFSLPTDDGSGSWTEIQGDPDTANFGARLWYKKASGTETQVSVTMVDPGRVHMWVAELDGIDTTTPLDDSNEDQTNVASVTTSQGTGSITPTADGIAAAIIVLNRKSLWTTGLSKPGAPWTVQIDETTPGSTDPVCILATDVYTGTSAKSTSASTTGTGTIAWGAIANFLEPAAAATGQPVARRHGGVPFMRLNRGIF